MSGFRRAENPAESERLFRSMSPDDLVRNSLEAAIVIDGLTSDVQVAIKVAETYRKAYVNLLEAIHSMSVATARRSRKVRERAFAELLERATDLERRSVDLSKLGPVLEHAEQRVSL